MKLFKALLLMSVATGVTAQAHDYKTYIRGQIGASKGVQTRRDSRLPGAQGGTKKSDIGLHGGIGVELRKTLRHEHPKLVGGIGIDANMETSKFKQHGTPTSAGGTLDTEVRRQVAVNALAHLGWKVKQNVMPYVLGGASYAQFKFSNTWKNSSTIRSNGRTKNIIGWSGGLGLGWGISKKWATDLRYLYTYYGKVQSTLPVSTVLSNVQPPRGYHTVTVGVSYKI